MTSFKFLIILMFAPGFLNGQTKKNLYMGQKSPGLTPQIFSPGFISKDNRKEFGSVFSKDGTSFYMGEDQWGKSVIWFSELKDGKWSEPKIQFEFGEYGGNDPMLTPDEERLFFISQMPLNQKGNKKDYDIWFVEKEGKDWSEPKNAGNEINTSSNEYYISFTDSNIMYFSSNKEASEDNPNNFDIYKSAFINGKFQRAEKLPDEINTNAYEADVFVAPDESYIIFCGMRKDGFGRGDLYISFRMSDGFWTKAKNMGNTINNGDHQLCPFVTKDGKYFLYTSNNDIYWVEASILENYRDK